MAHTYTHFLNHLIFSTKDHRPLLDTVFRDRLFPYMCGIFRKLGASVSAINGTADHVHILVSLPPDKSVSDIMRLVKTNSSRWVHETLPEYKTFSWQIGYGGFSVSESGREDVCKYIASQEQHHKRMTFEEEFLLFLKKHGVKYDPKYLWK
jgi:REP element-mobilizing transposase RayT